MWGEAMLEKLSEKVIKFRWVIIAFWILFAGVVFLKAPLLSEVAKGDQASFLPANSDTSKASKLMKKLYPNKGEGSSLVLTFHRNGILNDKDKNYALELEKFLKENSVTYRVREVLSPFSQKKFEETMLSKNQLAAYLVVNLNIPGYKEVTNEVVRSLRKIVSSGGDAGVKAAPAVPEGLIVNVTGDAALGQETTDNVKDSMSLTTKITIILVVLVLIFIYKSPVAQLVPLFTIALSFLISRGVVAELTNYGLKVSSFTETFMMAVLFGAGTDYCLLLTSRFREEIVKGKIPKEALKATLPNTWIAIVSSGATVIVGFLGMVLAKFGLYSTTGPSIAIGVGITILAVVTLTPAVIAVFGERIFWPAHPSKNIQKEREGSKFWNKLSMKVTQKPIRFILICLIVFIPFMVSYLGINRSFDQLSDLPSKSDAKKGFNVIKENFNQGEMLPVKIIMDGKRDIWSNETLQVVDEVAKNILKVGGVAKVRTATRPLGDPITEIGLSKQIEMFSNGLEELNSGSVKIENGMSSGSQDMSRLVSGTQIIIDGIGTIRSKLAASGEQFRSLSGSSKEFAKQLETLNDAIVRTKAATDTGYVFLETSVKAFESVAKRKTELLAEEELLKAYKDLKSAQGYIKGVSEGLGNIQKQLGEVKASISSSNKGIANSSQDIKSLDTALLSLEEGLEQIKRGQSQAVVGMKDAAAGLNKINSGISEVKSNTGKYTTNDNMKNVFYLPEGTLEKNPILKEGMGYYISPNGRGVSFDVILSIPPYTNEALDSAEEIKKAVAFTLKGTTLEKAEFYVTGSTAAFSELRDITAQDFTKVIFFVLLGIFIVLVLLLRSIIAPMYLILTIIFSYATTMGITYIVFQLILGQVGLTWSVPFFSFCILVALGVDYNIFLMSRVKEEYTPGNVTGGVQRALYSTGKIITSCGIIMAGTFGALMASPVNQLVQIGFTAVVGLLLDTFIIRCLMVPAIAVKVGELNWWPGRKVKILPLEKDKN